MNAPTASASNGQFRSNHVGPVRAVTGSTGSATVESGRVSRVFPGADMRRESTDRPSRMTCSRHIRAGSRLLSLATWKQWRRRPRDVAPRAPGRRRRGTGGVGLHPVPALLARTGEHRHQAVPVFGSRTTARTRAVSLGSARRLRHRAAPEHRIPLSDGPVLLAHGRGRRTRLGDPASLARHHLPRRRSRRAMALPPPRYSTMGCARRSARVPAHALPARVHGPVLGAALGLGRAPMARRAHDASCA